jgi:hypothetical protein
VLVLDFALFAPLFGAGSDVLEGFFTAGTAEGVLFATGGSRLVTVGFRLWVVVVAWPILAAEAAVDAAIEGGTRVDFGLGSDCIGAASFFDPFVLGEDGTCRLGGGLGGCKEVSRVSLGTVGGFFPC